MLVGTTIEVLPVVRVDDRPIADGRPGPITRRLQAAFRRAVEAWLAAGAEAARTPKVPMNPRDAGEPAHDDDPFERHARREPLGRAGVLRVVASIAAIPQRPN